ncbi:MAG: hypothetical protein ACQEWG_16385 [Bacteroidota bacterium]
MENYKSTYLRTIILIDDISSYHIELDEVENWNKKLRLLKNCFVALDILRDSFIHYNGLVKEDDVLVKQAKDIKKRLQFINHVRNKVSGHLDRSILEKAVQWEPQIFKKANHTNQEGQLLLTYKTLLESAINSYIDNDSVQKIFKTEIDLFYQPDQTLFLNFMGELNQDAINFLTNIKNLIADRIEFWGDHQLIEQAIIAGNTDFRLKK